MEGTLVLVRNMRSLLLLEKSKELLFICLLIAICNSMINSTVQTAEWICPSMKVRLLLKVWHKGGSWLMFRVYIFKGKFRKSHPLF